MRVFQVDPIRQFLFLLVGVLAGGCNSTAVLQSQSLDRTVTVDGSESEWQGLLTPLKDTGVTVGFLNDEDYLYLVLLSVDRSVIQQVILSGMTVWFDPSGGKDKTLGVQFPLGRMLSDRAGFRDPYRARARSREGFDPSQLAISEDMLEELELLRDGGNVHVRMRRNAVKGLSVAAAVYNETFVYELKIPLESSGDQSFGLGGHEGNEIGIGFETPKIERPEFDRGGGAPPGGGMPGGGMPGGGMQGDGPPPGGRGRPPQMPGMADPLQAWTKVVLTEKKSAEIP